jgi:hypothetical protein
MSGPVMLLGGIAVFLVVTYFCWRWLASEGVK